MTLTNRKFTTVLFDLDDTLYQVEEIPRLMGCNIRRYMEEKLNIDATQIPAMSQQLYMNFGTTLAGLVASGHAIDFADWHEFIHGSLPYKKLLRRDARLRVLLKAIKLPKYIFTNADDKHAEICLELLGISDCFEGIISFESIQRAGIERGIIHHNTPVVCKPTRQAFELALIQAGITDPKSAIFFDDSVRNIVGANGLGIYSVLVGRTGGNSGADAEILRVHDIPSALPEVWWSLAGQEGATLMQAGVPVVPQELLFPPLEDHPAAPPSVLPAEEGEEEEAALESVVRRRSQQVMVQA